ncbi:C-X-C motif chemokine 13 isoform X1 [Salmo salar]|uniref:C-X-C motif chemokine 13 isoform X1 n=1 Tax=Salmo salar TaxID=8030 RepID=A0ABM3EA78_SALSA|nr:C-X-C motif chemokine 13 isoform X1 [Salmo salar]
MPLRSRCVRSVRSTVCIGSCAAVDFVRKPAWNCHTSLREYLLSTFPMNGCAACQKCRCIRTSSAFISPRLFHRIEILPPGAHCRQTEIIVTKKDKATVCVTPDARWINKVITKLQSSNKKKRSAELPHLNHH